MNRDLITSADFPTHKLVIKLEDGTYRTFYLNRRQADYLAKNINSQDRFITLPPDVDPDAPQFFPKTWAQMVKMTSQEMDDIRKKSLSSATPYLDEEAEKAKKKHQEEIRAWVAAHPKEWEEMKEQAFKKLSSTPSFFHAASDGTKKSLVHWEAYRMVSDSLSSNTAT